jgi:hypothetical protein
VTRRSRALPIVGLFAVALAVAGLAALSSPDGEGRSSHDGSPSTFFTDPTGGMAAYEALEDLGFAVDRWREPFSGLDERAGEGELMLTRGTGVRLSEREADALFGWLERGGHLVAALGPSGAEGRDEADDGVERLELAGILGVVTSSSAASWIGAVGAASPVRLDGDVRALDVATSSSAEPWVRYDVGAGGFWVFGDPAAFTNARLASHDHGVLLTELCADSGARRVWFDEYHLGFGEQAPFPALLASFLLVHPWGRLFLHGAIAAGLFVALGRRRIGPPTDEPQPPPPDATELMAGLLHWTADADKAKDLAERWERQHAERS